MQFYKMDQKNLMDNIRQNILNYNTTGLIYMPCQKSHNLCFIQPDFHTIVLSWHFSKISTPTDWHLVDAKNNLVKCPVLCDSKVFKDLYKSLSSVDTTDSTKHVPAKFKVLHKTLEFMYLCLDPIDCWQIQ